MGEGSRRSQAAGEARRGDREGFSFLVSHTADQYPTPHICCSLHLTPGCRTILHIILRATHVLCVTQMPPVMCHVTARAIQTHRTTHSKHTSRPSQTAHTAHAPFNTWHTNHSHTCTTARHPPHTTQHTSQPTHGLFTPPTLCLTPTLTHVPSVPPERTCPMPQPPTPHSFSFCTGQKYEGVATIIFKAGSPADKGER